MERLVLAATAAASSVAFGASSLASTVPAPGDWQALILGPLGALVVLAVGVLYFRGELADAKKQAAQDRAAILDLLRSSIEVSTRCHEAIAQNTDALDRVADVLDKCPGSPSRS